MRLALPILLSLVVIGILEAGFYLFRYVSERRRSELRRRLRALGRGQEVGPSLLRGGKLANAPLLNEALAAVPVARRLERLLEQADMNITVAQLLGYSLVVAGGGFVLGLVAQPGPVLALLLAGIGACVPSFTVVMARSRRSARISEQLPDALDMMARSLRAGHALQGSFQLVASEAPSPINVEFGRAFEEQRLGRTLDQAVVAMTERVPDNADLKIFAVSVVVQKETGGNLSEILENIAETIRARYRFYGKLRALTAEGRMSGVVLGILPLAMGAFLGVVNPTYLSALFVTPIGQLILGGAILSWLLGLVWMFRMAQVDY